MPGSLEVVCGCMYSGKSDRLLWLVDRARYAKQPADLFKPAIDTRYGKNKVVTHNGVDLPCISAPQDDPEWILRSWSGNPDKFKGGIWVSDWSWDAKVIAIDEVQFFAPAIVQVCQTLVAAGKRVIVAGLDLNYKAEPFGSMPHLLALADKVDKLTAHCTVCGGVATRTQRLTASHELVELGSFGTYDARCHDHFSIPSD